MNQWPKNVCFISRATTEASECRRAGTLCFRSPLHYPVCWFSTEFSLSRTPPLKHTSRAPPFISMIHIFIWHFFIEPMTSHIDQYSNKMGFLAQLKGGLKQTQNEFHIDRMPRAAALTHKSEHLLYRRWRLHISGSLVIKSQAVMAWRSFHASQARYYMEFMFKYAKTNSVLRKKITWTILIADKKKCSEYKVCWKKTHFPPIKVTRWIQKCGCCDTKIKSLSIMTLITECDCINSTPLHSQHDTSNTFSWCFHATEPSGLSNRRAEADGPSPEWTDPPSVIVLRAGMWTGEIHLCPEAKLMPCHVAFGVWGQI